MSSIENKHFEKQNYYQVALTKGEYDNCTFVNCVFSDSDLSNVSFTECEFQDCDFKAAIFERTIVEKTDFRTSYNYAIDPENNKIKKAKFSMPEVLGLLSKYNIEVK